MARLLRDLLVLSSVGFLQLSTSVFNTVVFAQSTQNLRDFANEGVPGPSGPSELLESLKRLGIKPAGTGTQEWVDDFVKQGKRILEGMSPEQQKGIRDLAEKYMHDRGITPGQNPDESVTELTQQLQQQLQDDPAAIEQIRQLQKQFEQIERSQPENNSPPGVQPVNPVPRNLLPGQVPRSPGSNPPDRNNDDPADAENVVRPSPEKAPNSGSNSGTDEPPFPKNPPAKNTPRTPSGDPGSGNSSTNSNSGSPFKLPPVAPPSPIEENVGVRFDRMLIDAAKKGLESADADTRSQIAGSINSILDQLAENVETVVKNHGSKSGLQNARRTPRGKRPPSPFSSFGGSASGGSFSMAGLLSLWPWVVGAIGLVVAVWLLRYSGVVGMPGQERDEDRPVRYRYSRTRSPEQLVKSVDRFLLARFGRGASWWNVRRAQALLSNQEVRRVSDARLEQLVCAYEQARYSSTKDGPGPDQIESIGEVLRELALDLSSGPPESQVQTIQ